MTSADHEVLGLLKNSVQPLSVKLSEMLNEHYSHQTERRGCGYTQATRVLAEYVNSARDSEDFQDLKLFENWETKQLRKIIEHSATHHLDLSDWHNLDQNTQVQAYLAVADDGEYKTALDTEYRRQAALRNLSQKATLEESKLICSLIEDVLLPKSAANTGLVELNNISDKPKVGSCPMAENFFLKIAHRQLLRQGEINIFVDDDGQPLLMEKMNMGDDHSCISLKPLIMNGIRLPVGSLFSVNYDRAEVADKRPNKEFKGYVMHHTAINGFWFLRLTTLAVSPENRKRAFSTHFEQQVANGLFSPGTTEMQQLINVALSQLD
ncbi:hypothetical protein [Acinetobacter tianfuensis]|uniref:Uncharacterized protein n=1 Tax=Acinetobacter tianfuensis TaxID=2419603 RepID=A0A3A8EKS0_9GAMM|nr:hypothetical protein [Acinetobacter tianfuensis]RKG34709.1 hypothetical protein D7V32_01235 [Acinetobacter tianfuensis]